MKPGMQSNWRRALTLLGVGVALLVVFGGSGLFEVGLGVGVGEGPTQTPPMHVMMKV